MKSSSRPNVDAVKECRGPMPIYCGQCGQIHKPKECPAYGLECSICRKLHQSHFVKVCCSKKFLPRQEHSTRSQRTPHKSDCNSQTEDEMFMRCKRLTTALKMILTRDHDKLTIKLDTGAEVSVLPLHLYNKLQVKPTLKATIMKLSAYGALLLNPMVHVNLPVLVTVRCAI